MPLENKLNQTAGQDAEALAINALSFLAGRPDDLGRFLALTGIDPSTLRQCAAEPQFLGGVLDFLLQDEALMMVFAETEGVAPAAIVKARHRLDPTATGS